MIITGLCPLTSDIDSPLKKRNGSGIAQSEFEKAEEFNGQFSDVFTKSEYKRVPLMDRSAPFMHDIVVTKEGVTKLLKGLNPTKALGPDELHPRVLKELAMELGPVFAHLFQQSIDTGEIRLFADDCVCYREIKNEEDTLKLQRDIDRLGSWAR